MCRRGGVGGVLVVLCLVVGGLYGVRVVGGCGVVGVGQTFSVLEDSIKSERNIN